MEVQFEEYAQSAYIYSLHPNRRDEKTFLKLRSHLSPIQLHNI